MARLVAMEKPEAPRVPGKVIEVTYIAEDFDEPDPEIVDLFEGRDYWTCCSIRMWSSGGTTEAIDGRARSGRSLPIPANGSSCRSEERRDGTEWVSTGRSRWTPTHKTKQVIPKS